MGWGTQLEAENSRVIKRNTQKQVNRKSRTALVTDEKNLRYHHYLFGHRMCIVQGSPTNEIHRQNMTLRAVPDVVALPKTIGMIRLKRPPFQNSTCPVLAVNHTPKMITYARNITITWQSTYSHYAPLKPIDYDTRIRHVDM